MAKTGHSALVSQSLLKNNFFVCLACVTNLSDYTEIVIEVSLGVKTELAEKACCDVAVDPFSNNVLRLCGSSDCH